MKRLLFVMIDGFGDLNVPSRTEKYHFEDIFSNLNTPLISRYFISGHGGYYGLMDPVEPGVACGSDTAHLSIFGFRPTQYYTGRGAFETIGTGLSMSPGEIAFKCNFAFADESTNLVLQRRVDKDFASEAHELCFYLQRELNKPGSSLEAEGITVTIKHATEHRCGIKIKKSHNILSDRITGTDPLYDKCTALQLDDEKAKLASEIVERVSAKITELLIQHPINLERKKQKRPIANVILFRGCSRAPSLTNFDKFHDIVWDPIMMARTCIISGIGRELGFRICPNIGEEHLFETYSTIFQDLSVFIDDLSDRHECKFAFFHIKAVDEASHDQDFKYKIAMIESIDQILDYTIKTLIKKFCSDEFRIILTGDHTTLCRIGEHSCEPVPFLISKPLTKNSTIDEYDSTSRISECYYNNNIGRFSGDSVISLLKHVINSNEEVE